MKEIDTSTWLRKSSYEWFNTFDNPCYGFDVEMDITKLYNLTKKKKNSFFINMLYIVSYALNECEPLRYRILNDKVVVHDIINPSYTVMTKSGMFENCGNKMTYHYKEFYHLAEEKIENAKKQTTIKDIYNDSKLYDDFYITCIPWLEYKSMSHPLPSNDKSSSSVPRICWDKYHVHEDDKVTIHLNITVNHALVDGYDLSNAFNKIQEMLNNCEKYLK